MGFTFYLYVYSRGEKENDLKDRNHSPLQLISQIKGYFYINPFIAISLGITLFSFVGIPPLVGFFAKQMVLSAALDQGYVFISFVAIITSVIGAGYYLSLIKQIFFFNHDYQINPALYKRSEDITLHGYISPSPLFFSEKTENKLGKKHITFTPQNITVASSLSSTISINTLLLTLFIFMPTE
jgi:NADH-ubiquinone oxidoreductase chain 2